MTQPRTFLRYKNGYERELPYAYSDGLIEVTSVHFRYRDGLIIGYCRPKFIGPTKIKINGKVEFIVWEES